MNTLTLALVALSSFAALPAAAQTTVTDSDGTCSTEELQAAYPDLTDETFKTVDVNAHGAVDADELKAALDAGLPPA